MKKEKYYEAVPVYKKGSMNQEDIFGQLANSLLPRAVIAFSPTIFVYPNLNVKRARNLELLSRIPIAC